MRAHKRRLPNPSTTWGGAFAAMGLGGVGGLLAGGMDWGCDYLPIPAWGQAASLGGAALLTSVPIAKWGDVRVGAGIAGGATALLMGRLRTLVSLAGMGEGVGQGEQSEASAVRRAREAGAIRNARAREAAQLPPRSMAAPRMPGQPAFRRQEAAAYRNVDAKRRYGPHSWIAAADAGKVEWVPSTRA